MAKSLQEVLVECREHDIKAVALHVTDILGRWHQMTIPVSRLTEESFEDGFAWTVNRQAAERGHLSDVLLIPIPSTAFVEPFADPPTLGLLCTMHDPVTREELPEDPRTVASKAEKYARESGVAEEILFSVTAEFFLFDSTKNARRSRSTPAATDDDTLEELDVPRGRFLMGGMHDDFRNALMHALIDCGVPILSHRQSPIDPCKSLLQLGEASLVDAADRLMLTKHIVKRLAIRAGKSATFMPFPQAGRQPARMPIQLSLLKHGNCVLTGAGYAGLSDAGTHAIGGLLRHAAAIVALTNSTTNSFAGLGACSDSLPQIAYSQSDLRATVRIPSLSPSKNKCLEFRPPDAACNPYLAFTALLMAAIDGVQNKISPGQPLDPQPYAAPETLSTTYAQVPASFEAALMALENDGEFLIRGDVLSPEVLENWLRHKQLIDIQSLRSQAHSHEIALYYDI